MSDDVTIIEQNMVEVKPLDPNRDLYPDVMVDLETTGINKSHTAIIQIAAVKFNLAERTVCPDVFDRCLLIPSNRYWDEGTRGWWSKIPNVLQGIMNRMEDPLEVLKGLIQFAERGDRRMWAKPTHFDHAFLEDYFSSYGLQIPFAFYNAKDMNSFITGRYFPEDAPKWDKVLPFEGDKHNALHDCFHQIEALFRATDDTSVRTGLKPLVNGQ